MVKEQMKDHVIEIKGTEIVGGELKLIMTDGGDVYNAHKNDTVTWIINSDSGVEEIEYSKKKGDDVFEEKPEKKAPKKWSGKIKDKINEPKEEEFYTLHFILQNGTEGDHDPIIQVNS